MEKRNPGKKMNNTGFSLIELIVVILILGILAGGATISISQISNSNVTACTQKLTNMLDKARLETISKVETVLLRLYYDDGSYYAQISVQGNNEEEILLGNSGVNISAFESMTEYDIKSAPIVIQFTKNSGAYTAYTGSVVFDKIVIKGSRQSTVYLVKETGRCYVE